MENSMNSIIRVLSCKTVRSSTEEESEKSGWTSYMEDFLFDSIRDENGGFSCSANSESCYCSLVSCDAADSSVCRKYSNGGRAASCMQMDRSCCLRLNGLNRKKRKTAEDDDLEDTATSPHTPISEVSYLNQMNYLLSQKQKRLREITQAKHKGKGSFAGHFEERIEVGFVGRDADCTSGLKNIGLCLVPLSMAVNHFS